MDDANVTVNLTEAGKAVLDLMSERDAYRRQATKFVEELVAIDRGDIVDRVLDGRERHRSVTDTVRRAWLVIATLGGPSIGAMVVLMGGSFILAWGVGSLLTVAAVAIGGRDAARSKAEAIEIKAGRTPTIERGQGWVCVDCAKPEKLAPAVTDLRIERDRLRAQLNLAFDDLLELAKLIDYLSSQVIAAHRALGVHDPALRRRCIETISGVMSRSMSKDDRTAWAANSAAVVGRRGEHGDDTQN